MKLILTTIKDELQSFLLKMLGVGEDVKAPTPKKEESMDLILRHPCFTELSMWKNTRLNHLDIKDDAKREMTKEYIRIIQSVCENRMEKLKSLSFDEAYNMFTTDIISNTVTSIANEVHRISSINEIPYIFLDKAEGIIFRHMEEMEEVIMDVQLFGIWEHDIDKILATLDIVYAYIRMMGVEIPLLVNSMNGELKMALEGSKYSPI